MKLKLTPILTAVALTAMSFAAAPAKAVPTVTVSLDGFFFAVEDGLTFSALGGLVIPPVTPLVPEITPAIAAALDAVAPINPFDPTGPGAYGLALGLHYEVAVTDEPSPSTLRNWELAIDFGLSGFLDGPSGLEPFDTTVVEDLIGMTFPIPGIPISDFVGPFSVDDLADIGGFILSIFDECGPTASPTVISDGGDDIGACLFEPSGLLSGDIFLGLDIESTGYLLFGLLDLGPVIGDAEVIGLSFDAELILTEVPEPGTLALFGLGLAGLGIARRRKAA